MKIRLSFALLAAGLAACDNVPYGFEREEVDGNIYEIRSAGTDLRVYEWVSPVSGLSCVFVAGSSKGGLHCSELKQ